MGGNIKSVWVFILVLERCLHFRPERYSGKSSTAALVHPPPPPWPVGPLAAAVVGQK